MPTQDQKLGDLALEHALRIIRSRYELGSIQDCLAYHNRQHTEGVARRAKWIAAEMRLTSHDRTLVIIAAAFHDLVQTWEPALRDDRSIVRKRFTGEDEHAAADEAVVWMKDHFFDQESCDIVHEAICTTISAWDSDANTSIQPGLTSRSHPVARAVALADLGSAGMEPSLFRSEGHQLFIEQELGIIERIRKAEAPETFSLRRQKWYLRRYLTWMRSQAAFAEGRKTLLPRELRGLDAATKIRITKLFSGFSESIRIAQENARTATKLSFVELAHSLVPKAFPNY